MLLLSKLAVNWPRLRRVLGVLQALLGLLSGLSLSLLLLLLLFDGSHSRVL